MSFHAWKYSLYLHFLQAESDPYLHFLQSKSAVVGMVGVVWCVLFVLLCLSSLAVRQIDICLFSVYTARMIKPQGTQMSNFIGRQKELKLLEGLLLKKTASLVVVYGRRRVGKSRLVAEFSSKCRFISFSGIFPEKETTNQDQLNEFSRRFKDQLGKDTGLLTDWGDAFQQLATEARTGRIIILLDEITWMGEQDPNFLGKLKNAWDMEFKKNDQLILVLCGSVSSWIEKKILENRGYYGRISLKLRLKELPLSDCARFWDGRGGQISNYEKFKILSVTGGIPKYLEEIRVDQSADENIRRLCFSRHGQLYNDYEYIFLSLLERDSPYYQDIIQILSQNSFDRSDILDRINLSDTGLLSNYLEELTISGFLSRDFT